MKKIFFAGVPFLSLIAACSSNPNRAKELDTEIDVRGGVNTESASQTVGLNKDKEPIVQQLVAPDQEIKELLWKQYDGERKVASGLDQLQRCQTEISDPRLGGTGKIPPAPDLESAKSTNSVHQEIGLTEKGDLRIVKTENLQDRLKRESDYLKALQTDAKSIDRLELECEAGLRAARVSHGLPGERYTGVGHYENGRYVQTRRAENNLDDAFQIASEEAATQSKPNASPSLSTL